MNENIIDNDHTKIEALGISLFCDWKIVNGDLALQKHEVNLAKKIHNRLTCKLNTFFYNPNYGSVLLYLKHRYKSGIDETLISEIVKETILSEQSVTRVLSLDVSYDDPSFTIMVIKARLLVNGKLDVDFMEKIPVNDYVR